MARRQDEKERRRRERQAQEEAERRAEARRKRLQLVFGGVLGVALLAAVAIALVSAAGGGDDEMPVEAGGQAASGEGVSLPEPQETDFEAAAKAAGCQLQHPPNEGAEHADRKFTAADYATNPPTSGTHTPVAAEDGVYEPGNPPEIGPLVHSLEHGRINVQYAPGTPDRTIAQLEAFLAEKSNYHALLYENPTDMPYAVAATAWNQLLGCEEMNPRVFDALRTFYDRYVDKGPEQVP